MKSAIFICVLLFGGYIDMIEAAEDSKTYLFAVRQFQLAGYSTYDEQTGEISGFITDLVNEVCRRAKKKCDFYLVSNLDQNQCWDANTLYSEGLFNNWFDSCTGYIETPKMSQSLHIFGSNVRPISALVLMASEENKAADAAHSKVGFVRGMVATRECLSGFGVEVGEAVYYPTIDAQLKAVQAGEVEMGFTIKRFGDDQNLKLVSGPYLCPGGNDFIMMTRKEKRIQLGWFEQYLDQMKADGTYKTMCEDFVRLGGHQNILQCL